MEDKRSDEILVTDYQSGDNSALDILFRRYDNRTYCYLLKKSLINRDEAFIEDIKQKIFLLVLTKIRNGDFKPSGDGSFRAWFYTIAQNICRSCNYWRIKEPKNIYGIVLDLIPSKPLPSPEEEKEKEDEIKGRLAKVLSKLSPDEQKLMIMLSDGMTYKQIHEEPEFAKYSLDYLMRKVYIIRRKIFKIKDKE